MTGRERHPLAGLGLLPTGAIGLSAGIVGVFLVPYGVGLLLLLACVAAFGVHGLRGAFAAGWVFGVAAVVAWIAWMTMTHVSRL